MKVPTSLFFTQFIQNRCSNIKVNNDTSDTMSLQNDKSADNPVLKSQLKKDVFCFSDLKDKLFDEKVRLYRSISESEYKNLLKGDVMNRGDNYATSDPRGWGAHNWISGYRFNYNEPVYFVTFKPEISSEIMDRRDNSRDTRYSIDEYTLKDVENIRKGTNAHGELVYSEDFENDLLKDKTEKLKEIDACKNIIRNGRSNKEKENAWDILASYAEEFPNVLDFDCDLERDFNKETYVNGMLTYINKSKNPKYLNLARECITIQILNPSIDIIKNATELLGKMGDESDVMLVVALEKSQKLSPYSAAIAMNNLIKDDSMDNWVVENLKNNNSNELLTLVQFFKLRNKNNKYNDIFRDILKYCTENDLKSAQYNNDLRSVVEICAFELQEEANPENIECLKPFFNPQTPRNYPDAEVNLAMLKIKNKIATASKTE